MIEPLLSVPLWFNKTIGTTFDVQLSKSGYNYVSDLVHSVEIEKMADPSELLTAHKLSILKHKLELKTKKLFMKESEKKQSSFTPSKP